MPDGALFLPVNTAEAMVVVKTGIKSIPKARCGGIYPQFCVNVKGWCKIKVDRGGVQGSLFAALIAMKQKSCSLSRAVAHPLFIYP